MTCPKCGGLMIMERLFQYYGPESGWRCINCGGQRVDRAHATSAHPGTKVAHREARPRQRRG
jgi:transposase-like protein